MERYIGEDAHGTSRTFVVMGERGKTVPQDVIATNGAALVGRLKNVPGCKHLCLQVGTQRALDCEILSAPVDELVVAHVSQSRGPKSDALDALDRADQRRAEAIKCPAFRRPDSAVSRRTGSLLAVAGRVDRSCGPVA